MTLPRILITPGEPAGIGPEITVKVAQQAHPFQLAACCDPSLLRDSAKALQLPLNIIDLHGQNLEEPFPAGTIGVIPEILAQPNTVSQLNPANAQYVLNTLKTATNSCVKRDFDAVVTGPVQKSVINDAGIPFSGHTEFFAENSGTDKVVMMLATTGLRVALATTHLPLKDVAGAITQDNLNRVLQILITALKTTFNIANPTILIAGLNPHAGEGGHLGHEEIDTIIPVLKRFADQANLVGPLPADTLFTPPYLDKADAVLAMYHDQGLPVLKYKGFGKAVNITLGLPFIRTSVDHGTALNIAGQGVADESSLLEALQLAADMASKRVQP